jgi:hypothetical protein
VTEVLLIPASSSLQVMYTDPVVNVDRSAVILKKL